MLKTQAWKICCAHGSETRRGVCACVWGGGTDRVRAD